VLAAFKECLTNRIAVGYTLASALVLGGLFGFLNSAQQVFVDVLGAGKSFTLIFAGIAAGIAVASLVNSRIVGKLGMRRVSHVALCGYIAFAAVHALIALSGHETLWTFSILQACMMFCFGLTMSNFGALAMEPLGHLAGTAASVQGFITTIFGALFGFWIGQMFDGSTVPLTLGFTGFGVAGLIAVLITEKGRLFHSGAAAA
jgi:DHA1 family bicyclomycin/chloramphenicol resistance-like MFS transporter